MPEFVIQSRITPKKSLSAIVSRAGLIKEIERNSGKNLILVCAPAGYGKTTLVQEYLSVYSKTFAWFHISAEVSNFYTFVVYVVHALRSINKDFGANTLEAVESLKQSMNLAAELKNIVTIVVGTLINDILNSPSPDITLVLDDLHEAQSADWFKPAFDTLLEDFPANLHLIITSRNIPEFNLAKLASKRNLFTIDSKQLHFTAEEIDELLRDVYSIKRVKNDSEALERNLNGWITGIHLVLQAYGENFRKAELGTGDIFEFFANEVFSKLDGNLKNFLLETCYLDSFTAGDCNNLLGIKNSGQIIDELIGRNIFIESASVPDEASGKTLNAYSYHKLFKEYLSSRLHEEKTEDELKETLRRIYNYYTEKKNYESALGFSLFAKDYDASLELIKKVFENRFEDNQFELLWKWLSDFPDEIVECDPRLLYYKGLLLRFFKSDADGAHKCLQKALIGVEPGPGNKLYLDITSQMAETLMLIGKPEEALQILESVSGLNTPAPEKAKILYSLAYTLYRMGPENYGRISDIINDGIEICSANDLSAFLVNFYNLSGLVNSHKGDIIKGIYYYELALKQEKYVIPKMRHITNLIPLYVWSGEYLKAKDYMEQAERLYNSFPSVLLKRLLLRTNALFYFDFGDYETAVTILEELIDLEIKNNIKRFLFWHYLFIGECYIFLNKNELAGRYYEIALENIESGNSYQKLEYDLHIAILNKQTECGKTIETSLMNSHKYFEENGLIYAKAQVEFHLADYFYKKGLKDTALKYLRDSINVSAGKQYVSYLEQLYPTYRYLFDFAVSSNVHREFIKDILENIINKEEIGWLSAGFRKRLNDTMPVLYDISLRTFGGVELKVRGNHVKEDRWSRKKSKLILVYLLLNPGTKFAKDKILGLFFGDLNSESAENIFHQAITNIRSALKFDDGTKIESKPKEKSKAGKILTKKEKESEGGPNFILYEDKILRLNPNYHYIVDAVEFNEIYHRIKSAETGADEKIRLGQKALNLYKGELLAGNYDVWCEELRTNYANKFTDLCEEMISLFKNKNKHNELIRYAERLLEADRLHEEAYLNIIEAFVKTGNINMARAAFSRMLKAYDEEYGEKPPKKTLDAIQSLLESE